MQQRRIRDRRRGIRRGALARLREARAEFRLAAIERAGEAIGRLVRQVLAREDEAPRSHRGQVALKALVASRREDDALQELVPGEDALDLGLARLDEARAARRIRHRGEAGAADAAAP